MKLAAIVVPAALIAVAAGAAVSKERLRELKATGMIGEQPDGYLGTIAPPTAEVAAAVAEANAQRAQAYAHYSVSPSAADAAKFAACRSYAVPMVGTSYRLANGHWYAFTATKPKPPLPAGCPSREDLHY